MRVLMMVGLCLALSLPLASAAASSGTEKAAAESLYREANELARQGDFEAACPKYQSSQDLEPALGTMLRLADCWDRIGRTASAWALFLEASSLAEKAGENERREIAEQRISSLEARLTKIVLSANFDLPEGYELEVSGVVVVPEVWSTPLPIDPGNIVLRARVPGHEPRSVTIQVTDVAGVQDVLVPPLERSPPELSARKRHPAFSPEEPPRSNRRWQKPTGIAVGLVGLGGLAAGGVFSYLAHTRYQQSLEYCLASDPNQCDAEGIRLRNQSLTSADGATISLATGGGLAVVGLALLLTSPRSKERPDAVSTTAFSLRPELKRHSVGLSLSGVLR